MTRLECDRTRAPNFRASTPRRLLRRHKRPRPRSRRALSQSRLTVWTGDSGLPQNTVEAIVQTSDGYLWIGTDAGLARWRGERAAVLAVAEGLPSPIVRGMTGGPVRLSDTRFLSFTRKEGLSVDGTRERRKSSGADGQRYRRPMA